jgi:hypothetical protein
MKAIYFDEYNVIFAENQKEYVPVPACSQKNGLVTFCLELNKEEISFIKNLGAVVLEVHTFGNPVQPIRILTGKPTFPVTHRGSFHCSSYIWDEDGSIASRLITLTVSQLTSLSRNKKLWVTVATFMAPLQPFILKLEF